jgi:hypothetical protein
LWLAAIDQIRAAVRISADVIIEKAGDHGNPPATR